MQEVATTRVEVVGAGPGGLYAALLLARAGAEVRVHERNPPGETFGFGVVFSEATLGELATADAPSHAAFLAASARWDPVAIRRAGTEIRAHGNAFAAIGRHALLDVLERRAVELGVEVCHRHEADAGALDGADLVVVAEGARSASRDARRAAFRPRATREGSTFIWLGTHQPFDAFTFIFLETPDGPFTAHIYPYAANRATFIVETDRDTWRKAGLDRVRAEDLAPGESDQHSIAVLSELFADHLGGHPLDGNGSYWRDWATIRTATWRDGNVVLLGDAAHTAHFSIGSGTKLALEDAIALARWVGEEPELATALLRYEGERRPRVERVQAAASTSLDWFARHRRYAHFPPEQFAYSLLTRSARVDHDNLRRRDPALVRGVDAKLAGSSGGLSGMSDNHHDQARAVVARARVELPPPPWLLPLQLGGVTLVNRAVVVVRDDQEAVAGLPSQGHRHALEQAARSGAGLVLLDRIAVSAHGRASTGDAGLWATGHAHAWGSAVGASRQYPPAGLARATPVAEPEVRRSSTPQRVLVRATPVGASRRGTRALRRRARASRWGCG